MASAQTPEQHAWFATTLGFDALQAALKPVVAKVIEDAMAQAAKEKAKAAFERCHLLAAGT